jgi:hypothetical protein
MLFTLVRSKYYDLYPILTHNKLSMPSLKAGYTRNCILDKYTCTSVLNKYT